MFSSGCLGTGLVMSVSISCGWRIIHNSICLARLYEEAFVFKLLLFFLQLTWQRPHTKTHHEAQREVELQWTQTITR